MLVAVHPKFQQGKIEMKQDGFYYAKCDDATLVEHAQKGNETAYGVLVDRYRTYVHTLICRRVKDFHESEDLTQETFLRVWLKMQKDKKPVRIKSFKSWIRTSAKNLAIDWLRKNKGKSKAGLNNEVPKEYPSQEKPILNRLISHEQIEALMQAFWRLPKGCRQIIKGYYFEGLRYKDIRKTLDKPKSVNAMRLSKGRILKKLKKMISEILEEEDIDEFRGSIPLAGLSFENMRRIIENSQRGLPTSQTFTLSPWLATTGLAIGGALIIHWSGSQLQPPDSFDSSKLAKVVDIADIPADKKPSLRSLPVSRKNRSRQKTIDQSTQKTTADPQEYEITVTIGKDEKVGYLEVWNLNRDIRGGDTNGKSRTDRRGS